jgi:hypothetical protein
MAERTLDRASSPSFHGFGRLLRAVLVSLLVGPRSGLYVDDMCARALPLRSGMDGDLNCVLKSPCGRGPAVVIPLDRPRGGTGPMVTATSAFANAGRGIGSSSFVCVDIRLCLSLGSRGELGWLESRR